MSSLALFVCRYTNVSCSHPQSIFKSYLFAMVLRCVLTYAGTLLLDPVSALYSVLTTVDATKFSRLSSLRCNSHVHGHIATALTNQSLHFFARLLSEGWTLFTQMLGTGGDLERALGCSPLQYLAKEGVLAALAACLEAPQHIDCACTVITHVSCTKWTSSGPQCLSPLPNAHVHPADTLARTLARMHAQTLCLRMITLQNANMQNALKAVSTCIK